MGYLWISDGSKSIEELSHSDILVLNKNSCPIHQGLFGCPMAFLNGWHHSGTPGGDGVSDGEKKDNLLGWDDGKVAWQMKGDLLYPLVICDIAIENGDL